MKGAKKLFGILKKKVVVTMAGSSYGSYKSSNLSAYEKLDYIHYS